MAKRNGYFQLQIDTGSISMKLFPPTEGGAEISLNDMMEYLNSVGIKEYDPKAIQASLDGLNAPKIIPIANQSSAPIPEKAKVQISQDRMYATIRLYPPSNGGKAFTKSDFAGEVSLAGIKCGVSDKVIDLLIATPVYCHDIVFAKGKPVREGHDAEIKYNFETNPLAKPKLNEDGTVDFHELNIFTRVEKNQLLATLIPEDPGEAGHDLFQNPVLPRKVKKKVLKCGRNIRYSEDRLQMFSEVSGDVRLEGDTVFVSDTYTVAADVDTSTGDITYSGNVVVNGNVRTGFKIHAEGDVQVKGVVEGAEIYAEGNIILARGIQGMTKGILEARGDIVTKFIESAKVKAGGNVRSGSILHSTVEAGSTILCEGRKSYVVGGTLSAKELVDVKTIGNEMESTTNVNLGVDASIMENLHAMQKEFEANKELLEAQVQVLLLFKKRIASGQQMTKDKLEAAKHAGDEKKRLDERQEELQKGIEGAKQEIAANTLGRLKVRDTAYPGVRLMISNSQYVVKTAMKYCQFRIRDGEVVAEAL